MSDVSKEQVLEFLDGLTVLQLSELTKELEDRWGVTAAAAVAVAAPAASGGDGGAVEEQTEFDVLLANIGDKKIQVIKAVRSITGLGLKEAKELVDGTPNTVKSGVSKDEAESLQKQLEEAGATVEVK